MEAVMRDAMVSACRRYRYSLTRAWGGVLNRNEVTFVMLNPSTADSEVDDPTIRKCVGFAKLWGYGALRVVNLFAWRATLPEDLVAAHRRGEDIVGHANAATLRLVDSPRIVCAWGANPVAELQAPRGARWPVAFRMRELHCLGKTQNGSPKHPLYIPYAQPLERYP